MRTIITAPPPRRSINWYRVAVYVLAAAVALGLLWAALETWPYIFSAEGAYDAALADGHGGWFAVVLFFGSFGLFLVPVAGIALAGYAGLLLLVYLTKFVVWWHGKIRETDRKNKGELTYED